MNSFLITGLLLSTFLVFIGLGDNLLTSGLIYAIFCILIFLTIYLFRINKRNKVSQ